jgi:uncharacterized DUF497 family protein
MEFEWDDAKAASNLAKHGVSFEVVKELDWSDAVIRLDGRREYSEFRWRALHVDGDGTRYVVVFTERRGRYRIISVRRAHAKELRKWER